MAGGGHFFDPTEIVGTSVVAANDNLIIEDESNSTNAARTVSVAIFADSLADGATITASNGVLSSVSGGATITDTAIAEDATTESTTGGASRQAIAEMRDGERHIRYHTSLPDASDIPDAQTDDIHVLLDSDENAIALYHFSIVEETEEWLLTVGVGLGIRGYAAGVATGYGHISPNGPSIGFTALNRGTTGRFTLVYDRATTGLVRADSRTLYIRQRGTSGNWHVVQMDEIATPYAYESTTSGHNFTFREGTAYNVIVRRAADTNDGANIAAVLTTDRDIAFEDGASLVQLADVQDLLHIGEVVEVVYQQVAGLAAAEVAVDASAFAGNLSATDIDAQTAFETINALTLGGAGGTATEATFKGALASTSTTAAAYGNVFTITETINVGGFSVETDVSAAGFQVVRVPSAGRYRACADVAFTQTTAGNNNSRIEGHTRFAEVEDATTITADASHGNGYARAINNGLLDSAAVICTVLDLDLGDDVAVQFLAEIEAGTMGIDGGNVSLVLVGGLTGAAGATGPPGIDGGTDDQTAAEVSVDATGFNGNLATTDDTAQKVAQKVDDLNVGGSGDITAVTTSGGISGGCTTGACALFLNLPGLPNSASITGTGTLAGATGGGSSVEYAVAGVVTYVRGQIVTDTALNANPALESQSTAPSRQLVAELRDSLTNGGGTVNFSDVEGTVAADQFADDTIAIDRLLGDVANFGGDVIRATTTGNFEVGPIFFGELSGGTNFVANHSGRHEHHRNQQWRPVGTAPARDVVWRWPDGSRTPRPLP